MNTLTTIAISIVIILHVFFLIVEMFLWNSPFGRKTFSLKEDFARQSTTLAANQGLYNGFLAAGLLWGLVSTGGFDALIFFLSCIIIAGIYGAFTASKSILFIQALPAAIAITLLILTAPNSVAASTTSVVKDFPFTFEKVTKNTWVMHGPRELPNPKNKGFMNNPGLVQTSAGLVIIDPGSSLQFGKHLLNEIKKISKQKIVGIFNTHIHGDHWLANQAIKVAYPEVKIYGHTNMLAEIANGEGEYWLNLMDSMTEGASKGTVVISPDTAVDNDDIIKIGDTQFKMHHYGIAHTNNDIMIEVVENSVIFLGDNVLSLRIPRTSDGTFQGNISTIKTILNSNIQTYVPGHGPTGGRIMVETFLNYLTLIYNAAKIAFEQDLDSSDVLAISKKSTAAYKNWPGYDASIGSQGAQAYSEVEAAEF